MRGREQRGIELKGPNLRHFQSGAGLRAGCLPRAVPSLDPGGLPGAALPFLPLALTVPWGAAVTARTSSQLLFPAETESA